MTSVAIIVRMHIRDFSKRQALFQESIEKLDKFLDLIENLPVSEYGVNQWDGDHIQKYLDLFDILEPSDIDLQILFEK